MKTCFHIWTAAALALTLVTAPLFAQAPAKEGAKAKAAQGTAKAKAGSAGAKAKAGAARTITLEGSDTLRYTPATIRAKPGETLRVVLTTKSMMPKAAMAHNFVLLTKDANVATFATDAARARATEYIPAARKADVLASTGLAGAGETVEVTFTAPKEPGTYMFICTFPAHYQGGMKGTLTVE